MKEFFQKAPQAIKLSVRSFLSLSSLWFIFLIALPAHAEGLAMHGAPKYGPADTHLSYANPDAPKGGTMKSAAIGTFDTLNPYTIKGKAAQGLNLFTDRLMRRVWDEPFTLYPLIAQSYDMPQDRSAITFHLNPAARFHDGRPITADDILFSFETLKEHGRPNMRRVYRLVREAKKLDNDSVRFTFGEGYDRETALIMAIMPVLSKAYWQDRDFDSTILEAFNSNGPYRIHKVDPGRAITYKRDPDYWARDLFANRGHYNIDEITYEYYRDDSVAAAAFDAGDLNFRRIVDLSEWANDYSFHQTRPGGSVPDDKLIALNNFQHGRPEKARGFIFNTRRAPFDDIKIREALSLVLDRNKINSLLFNNEKKLIRSYFPNSEFDACRECEFEPPHSVRESLRLATSHLKDSGWVVENGAQTKDGTPFEFEVLLQNPEDEKIALNFQQALKRLGITMHIRTTDSADFLRRIQAYDYDMVLHHWQSSLSPGTEQLLYWGCEAAKQEGRFNYAGICDPDIDALATAVANTVTREELVATMQKLDKKLLAGHYMIPLFYNGQDYFAHAARIKHSPETPLYGAVLESWWIE